MSFFRSRPMKHYNLVIPRESAWQVMDQLGLLDQIHFVDYDATIPMINRPFANSVKRCDETLFKLAQIEGHLNSFKKQIVRCSDVAQLMTYFRNNLSQRQKAQHTYFEELEQEIEKKRFTLMESIQNYENLQERSNTIIEQQQVLLKCQQLLGENFFGNNNKQSDIDIHASGIDEIRRLSGSIRFNQLIGVISKEDETRFKRMVFRITKGNIWMQVVDINDEQLNQMIDPFTHQALKKAVFILVYPGMSDNSLIKVKLQKIAETFSRSRFDFPSSPAEYHRKLEDLARQLEDTQQLIIMSKRQIDVSLESFSKKDKSNCSLIEAYRLYVIREKYLYQNLNYLRMQGSIFTGIFWLPDGQEVSVENALRNIQSSSHDRIPTGQITEIQAVGKPPTYFNLNPFTSVFQEIINTYGIPRYQEVNPALFAVVTFPFIFGMMFADIGHGFMLLLTGLYVWLFHHNIEEGSMFKAMFPGRFLIILMGFFAFYNGLIYNDFLSIPLNLFGSCYFQTENKEGHTIWERKEDCVYPFGIDPVWLASGSALTFINSYKMKLSVIMGVVHMLLGIVMKGVNALYFKNYIDFFCEFIPQFLFMICTFGWMDMMIIYKWTNYYTPEFAPSIITLMIDQTLSPGKNPDPSLFDAQQQRVISNFLMVIAVICVPWMLYPKAYLLKRKAKKHNFHSKVEDFSQKEVPQKQASSEVDIDTQEFGQALLHHSFKESSEKEESHDESEIMVHQVIETIEFVLGSISNTASYLRLWALSLAHGQLADVFYDMFLSSAIGSGGFVGGLKASIMFFAFAALTFGVLMVMDVMECFLHALRLHWVEFQSKFYKADGYLFVNYSFYKVITQNIQ